MPVSAAYLAVVLIWSTTPLGIVWSSESVSPTLAVLARMVIALVLGALMIVLNRNISLPWHKSAIKLYAFSAVGIYGGMLLSYFAAAHISSGLMSLVFGLAPILSGLMAQRILHEPKFTWTKRIAMTISVLGLAIVCSANLALGDNAILGLGLIFCAVVFFSLSGVMVKSIEINIHPVATTVGALTLCVPLFALTWFLVDGTLPVAEWQARSIWAIVYLGIFGSLIGFVAYFFVLQKLPAATVALITMITPIIAICLGALLNNEFVSVRIMFGAVLVMFGLWIFQFGHKHLKKLPWYKSEGENCQP